MMNFNNKPSNTTVLPRLNEFMTKMYGFMFMSILIAAMVAYYAGDVMHYQLTAGVGIISIIAWFILPFILGRQAMHDTFAGTVELIIYAGLTGFVFSDIFEQYAGTTITSAFVSSSAIFGGMSIMGYVSHKDMTNLGTQLFGALIGLIVAMVINMFLRSPMAEFLLSIASVIIFALLTMFDTNQMKRIYSRYGDQLSLTGLAINGALALFLDFINIFTSLLEIFGGFGGNNN